MPEPLSSSNPYAALASEAFTFEEDEFLKFDGVITEAGYRSLLPLSSDQIMVWALLLLLPLGAAVLVAVLGFQIFVDGNWLATIPIIGWLLVWCGTLYGAIWLVNPASRSRRYLNANPDLLGVARGAFQPHGLTFYDGKITHWFSWLSLAETAVRPGGLRVPTSRDPVRYLALTGDIFLAYSPLYARAMIKRYARSASTQEELIQSSARTFRQKADNERFFAGSLVVTAPYNLREEIQVLVVALTYTSGLIICFALIKPSMLALFSLIGVTCLVIGLWCLRRYRRVGRQEAMYVWGWVLADRLIYASGQTAMEILLADFQSIQLTENYALFQYSDRMQIAVLAEHFSRPKIWQALSDELSERLTTGNG
ncbi:MAG: hypothetical protein ACTHK7_09245 [Aureliella sp.]